MTTAVRTRSNARNGEYEAVVDKAVKSRSNHFHYLNKFGSRKSAQTIRWMIQNGRGLHAFEQYTPGTFQAQIRDDVEVWFRLA